MIRRFRNRLRFRPGDRWDGPRAYATEIRGRPVPMAFYALTDDGKGHRWPPVRLVCVDDAPGDPADGACHWEVAGRDDPPARPGRPVLLKANLEGKTTLAPGAPPQDNREAMELGRERELDPALIEQAKANPTAFRDWLGSTSCDLDPETVARLLALYDEGEL